MEKEARLMLYVIEDGQCPQNQENMIPRQSLIQTKGTQTRSGGERKENGSRQGSEDLFAEESAGLSLLHYAAMQWTRPSRVCTTLLSTCSSGRGSRQPMSSRAARL